MAVTAAHSGASADSPVVIAAYPGEKATVSAGVPLKDLVWEPVKTSSGATAYKAALPSAVSGSGSFTGLFGSGKRLTRARYPNCDDITCTTCFTLNANGPVQ